jgi:uncharacterized repeat protein (TIGR04052 family)
MMRKPISIAALVAVATLFTACGSSSDTGPQPVTIDFKALVGSQTFNCADTAGYAIGTGTLPWIPKDFRFYVSNVRLVDAAGAEAPVTLDSSFWQGYGVALLDFEDGTGNCTGGTLETNTAVHGTVAAGSYVGLKFDMGVPTASNHLNYQAANPPLSNSAMYWSWTTGYKFIKVDGLINRATPFTFNFHLGSTGCALATPGDFSTASCTTLNVPAASFPAFDAGTQAVAFDIALLFATTNFDTADGGGAPGCMSGATDPECAPIFSRLGLPFGTTPAGSQASFRLVTK